MTPRTNYFHRARVKLELVKIEGLITFIFRYDGSNERATPLIKGGLDKMSGFWYALTV
jgi:hypothetical protein